MHKFLFQIISWLIKYLMGSLIGMQTCTHGRGHITLLPVSINTNSRKTCFLYKTTNPIDFKTRLVGNVVFITRIVVAVKRNAT